MADSTKANIYHSIKPNFGYSLNLSVANLIVKKHEDKTGTKYKVLRSDPNFGEATWNNEDCQIKWEESEKTPGERLPFDGIPFFVLGTRHLGCHFSETEKMNIYLDWKKDNDGSECEAKKEKCPAMIILKEVIKFPHYKIEANSAYEKKKWSKMVRDDLCKGEAEIQRRIYVELPKLDDHVHTITWKQKSDPGETADLSHCLVCNAKISASTRAKVAVFAEGARTSHRQLEVSAVLGDVVQEKLMPTSLHSTTICSKCFNLLDEIDSLEEQLANKKQYMVDKYSRTYKEVTGKHDSQDELMEADEDRDDGKQRSAKDRKRGRPPGSTRGRPRGRPRTKSAQKSPEKSIVKVEVDQDKLDEYSVSYISAVSSPPPSSLKTIKKEDIMSDMDSPVDHQKSKKRRIKEEDPDYSEENADEVLMDMQDDVSDDTEKVPKPNDGITEHACLQCNKYYKTKGSLRGHVRLFHGLASSYNCKKCDQSFSTKDLLKAHKETSHMTQKLLECTACGETFSTSYQLKNHLKVHAGHKNFICPECGLAVTTQESLDNHLISHSGERSYMCDLCGMTFRYGNNLNDHIRFTHNQEKKFQCELCQKSFPRKRLLAFHRNSVHTGERPYKCDICTAEFAYPHHFKKHLKNHSGIKPFKCSFCPKEFASRGNRNTHMFIHSNRRPYECNICNEGFMRKAHCLAHVSAHGPTENLEEYYAYNPPRVMEDIGTMEQQVSQEIITNEHIETENEKAVQGLQTAEETIKQDSFDSDSEMYEVVGDKLVKVMSPPRYIIQIGGQSR